MATRTRHIVLGVTGSIAAYRACELVEALKASNVQTTAVLTAEAKHFVGPLSFEALTGRPVYSELFDAGEGRGTVHITLADSADAVVVAPATANLIAKLAYGHADDLLSCILLATKAPILIAPAMNVHMWEHPAVQENVQRLKRMKVQFVEPAWGKLACGYEGVGHLAEVSTIVEAVMKLLK